MKKITFLVILANNKKPLTLSVPTFILRILSLALFVAISFIGFITLDYVQLCRMRQRHYNILAENSHLKGEAQILMQNLSEVKNSLKRIEDYTVKLDEIVNMKVKRIRKQTGLGPLDSVEDIEIPNADADTEVSEVSSNIPLGISLDHLVFKPVLDELSVIEQSSQKQTIELQKLLSTLSQKKSLLSSIPSILPVRGWVTSRFGGRISPFTGKHSLHRGVDIAAPVGSPIFAPADGVVIFSGPKAGFGNFIMIAHYGYGIVTSFGHNSQNLVQPGQKIVRGEQIASVGSSGRSTGPHLHYEVWVNGEAVNPRQFILDFKSDITNL